MHHAFGCTGEMPPTGRSFECIQRDECKFYSLNFSILQLAWVVVVVIFFSHFLMVLESGSMDFELDCIYNRVMPVMNGWMGFIMMCILLLFTVEFATLTSNRVTS